MSFKDLAKRVRENKSNNAPRPAVKVARKPDVTMESFMFDYNLNYRGVDEFVKFRRFAAQYVGERWAECAVIIDKGEDFEFFPPDRPDQADWDDVDEGLIVRMQYGAEYGSYIKTKAAYDSNKPRVFAYLWGKCTLAMQNAIRMDPEFPLYERDKDPIRLWVRIFDVSMNGTGLPENEAKRLESARYRFDKISQKPNETVGEFYQRFIQQYDAMVGQGAQLYNVIVPNGLDQAQLAAVEAEQEAKE